MPEAQSWTLIIATITTSIITIVTAFKVGKVHSLVNSAMTQEKAENALLRAMLTAKQIEIESSEKTRLALAKVTAESKNKALGTLALETKEALDKVASEAKIALEKIALEAKPVKN